MPIDTVVFDAFGTLYDIQSVASEDAFPTARRAMLDGAQHRPHDSDRHSNSIPWCRPASPTGEANVLFCIDSSVTTAALLTSRLTLFDQAADAGARRPTARVR
jgi:hypothetical protein